MPPRTKQNANKSAPKSTNKRDAKSAPKSAPKSATKTRNETLLLGLSKQQQDRLIELEEIKRKTEEAQDQQKAEAKRPSEFDEIIRRYPSRMENRLQLLSMEKEKPSAQKVEFLRSSIIQNMITKQLSVLVYDKKNVTDILKDVRRLSIKDQMKLLVFFTYSTFVGITNSVPQNTQPATLVKIQEIYEGTTTQEEIYGNIANSYKVIDSYLTIEIKSQISRRLYPSLSIRTMPNVIDINNNAPKIDFKGILGDWGVPLTDIDAILIQPNPENIMTNDPVMLKRAYSKDMADLHTDTFNKISNHLNNLINPVGVPDYEKMEALRLRIIEGLTKRRKKKDTIVADDTSAEDEDDTSAEDEDDTSDEEEEDTSDDTSYDDFIDDSVLDKGDSPPVYTCATCNKEITNGTPRKSIIKSGNNYSAVYFCPDGECLDNYEVF